MADVVVVSLSEDREGATAVTDALVSDSLDALLIVANPAGGSWEETVAAAAVARCTIYCWSEATTSDSALPYRALAACSAAAGQAIGVRFDAGVELPSDAPMTVYDLTKSSRLKPGWWQALLSGDYFLKEVVLAARNKRAGLDPPPPSAFRRMVRRRSLAGLLVLGSGMATLSGIAELFDYAPWPRVCERRAWQTLEPGLCKPLKAFVHRYPGGRYETEAKLSLANPEDRAVAVLRERPASISGPLAVGAGEMSEAAAKAVALRWADGELARQCAAYTRNIRGRFVSADLGKPGFTCSESSGRYLCVVESEGQCNIEEPVRQPWCAISRTSPPLLTRIIDPVWPECD